MSRSVSRSVGQPVGRSVTHPLTYALAHSRPHHALQVRDAFAAKNALDIELYEYAAQVFEFKRRDVGLPPTVQEASSAEGGGTQQGGSRGKRRRLRRGTYPGSGGGEGADGGGPRRGAGVVDYKGPKFVCDKTRMYCAGTPPSPTVMRAKRQQLLNLGGRGGGGVGGRRVGGGGRGRKPMMDTQVRHRRMQGAAHIVDDGDEETGAIQIDK